jgi:CRISPR-associated protein Csb2
MELLPELRKRQPRHFPVVTPDDDLIYFNWPDATPTADQREVIDRILGRIARIGHSATPVSCSLSDFAPPPTWAPSDSGSHELRTVGSGVLDVLTTEYTRHQGITSRVLPALMTNYAAPSAPKTLLATAANAGTWLVLPLSQEQRFPIHRTLDITRAVRSALMHHSPQPVPAFISGHGPGAAQTAPLADTHLSVLALPHATSPHADGLIHGIALAFPTGATQAERDDVLIALQRWTKDQTPDGDDPHYPVTMPGGLLRKLGLAREAATSDANRRSPNTVASRGYWSRVSDEWASVTPLALDRFPKARRGDDEALATAIFELVSASCDHVGLPSPVDVRADRRSLWAVAPPVTTGSGQRMSSGRPNRSFPQYSTGSAARPRFTAHVRIRFGEQVRGPIVLGAGRYFGYGLMMPIERDGLTT